MPPALPANVQITPGSYLVSRRQENATQDAGGLQEEKEVAQ
jgi:hypothetical protein